MILVSHRRRRRFARRLGLFFDPIPITVARVDSPSRADALAPREPAPHARLPSRARDVARRFRAVDRRRVGKCVGDESINPPPFVPRTLLSTGQTEP